MNLKETRNEIPTKTIDIPWIYVCKKKEEISVDEKVDDEEYIRMVLEEDKQFYDKIGRVIGEKKDKIQRINLQGEKVIVPLSEEAIDKIAIETNCTVGKWMLFISKDEVDDIWKRIANSVLTNNLGSCESAKVATALQGKDVYVICVYTNNYLDIEDVLLVREKLRELGFTQTLYYKPDIYTHLDIYSKNPYVKASRYKS
ncbi:MAG: DUF1917 domain-containing protein [Candidatus Heimdallarchaeota archaeon]|nr:DUF1917 domain-containing protein [Candidatus Heimdallarchaeota archaeon]